jgi:hypothetical protein
MTIDRPEYDVSVIATDDGYTAILSLMTVSGVAYQTITEVTGPTAAAVLSALADYLQPERRA